MNNNGSNPNSVAEMWPSKYLKADDLMGKTYELEIVRIAFENMRSKFTNQDELKAVLYFKDANKGLVLNKTQANKITEIVGSDVFAKWVGKRVRLWSGSARNGKATIYIGPPAKQDLV